MRCISISCYLDLIPKKGFSEGHTTSNGWKQILARQQFSHLPHPIEILREQDHDPGRSLVHSKHPEISVE